MWSSLLRSGFHCQRQKRSLSFFQRFALLPASHILTCFCLGPGCHSPSYRHLFFFLIFCAAHSQTLWWQGQSENKEQEVNLLTTKPKRGKESCSPSPCQKHCHFPERSQAQLSMDKAEADGWGVGVGEAYGKRHPSETHRPGGSLNTTAFLHVVLWINSFCPSFCFLGGEEPTYSFSRNISFFSKAKEN